MTNRQAAIGIIKTLRQHGFEALLAGGCVRDMLLRKRAKDYDVATNAEPQKVLGLFKRTVKVGVQFGVVIVLVKDQQVEVATFRSDEGYVDGRRPVRVHYTTAQEDANRRDFTVNGMFYDPMARQVIDHVKGAADLEQRIIRTIGPAQARFSEDYLRMLRAIRFSARLGFRIEPTTLGAIKTHAHHIVNISRERITMELEGILVHPGRAQAWRLLLDTALADHLFPGMVSQQWQAGVEVLGKLQKKAGFLLSLCAVFVGCDTAQALQQIKSLKLSRCQTRTCQFLLTHRGALLCDDMPLSELKLIGAEPQFWDVFELQRAVQRANGWPVTALTRIRRRIEALSAAELRPNPLLDGHVLIRLGVPSGPMVGRLLQAVYRAQLEGTLSSAQQAEQWVIERMKSEE